MLIQINTKPTLKTKFADSRGVDAALIRAALAAREVAKQFNIPIVI